jgi:CheY-like chemotaxis protein
MAARDLGEPPSSQPAEPPLVLAVDDNRQILAGLARLYGDRYRLLLCSSGESALAALSDDVCAVILDVRMAGMDGFATCAAIRSKNPDVPVIFYSAYKDCPDPYRLINESRPFAYITKGDDLSQLSQALHLAVRLQRAILDDRRRAGQPLAQSID